MSGEPLRPGFENVLTRRHRGSGMGLLTAKALIERGPAGTLQDGETHVEKKEQLYVSKRCRSRASAPGWRDL